MNKTNVKQKQKQKQIEEMAKDFLEIDVYQDDKCKECAHYICGDKCDDVCFAECCAKYFYNLHYRKIPENAVVLTREEYDGKEIVVEMSGGHKLRLSVGKFGEMSKILEEETRKETAEKFAESVHNLFYRDVKESVVYTIEEKDILKDFVESIDEICKEITEGQNGIIQN